MNGWPIVWLLYQMQGRFTKQDGTRFQVDSLVLEAHKQGPHGMRLVHANTMAIGIMQTRVIQNGVHDSFVNLLSVFMHLGHRRPKHVILMHIIPQHFIHTHFKDGFKVGIHWFGQDSTDSQLVDVQASRVSIVKNLRMTKTMRWGTTRVPSMRAVYNDVRSNDGGNDTTTDNIPIKTFLSLEPGK